MVQDKPFKRKLDDVNGDHGLQLNVVLITRRVNVLKRAVSSRRGDLAERAYRDFHGYRGGMSVSLSLINRVFKDRKALISQKFRKRGGGPVCQLEY